MLGVIGKKIGMSIILKEKGISIPVTIIEVLPNRIVQIKTNKKDGYNAIQLYNGTVKFNKKKKKVETVKEFRLSNQDFKTIGVGVNNGKDEITVSSFTIDEVVNVSGVSKGKGYQGTIKRWKFKSQNKSHGNSLAHRIAGSTGQCQTPGRVFKGKKMAGRMGTDKNTVKNLKIIKINLELNLIIIKGACPGFTGSKVLIKKIMKKKNEVKT